MPRKTKEQTNEQLDIKQKKTTKSTTNTTNAKKVSTKKETKTKAKTITKTTAKTATKKTPAKKTSSKKSKILSLPVEVEYYDLPYKYNETVVKVLYQNPTTLFVYWEISSADIENYKEKYGKNFFETTEPILTVYNHSMNYKFEVVINDFANSWYFNINDSECDYHVELGRRPKYNKNYEKNYIYITSSNDIESPNNRILYNTNESNSIYFKNVKNNESRKIELQSLIDQLNLNHNKMGFPYIKDLSDIYKNIFGVQDVYDLNKISNPSSESLSSRLK